MAHAFTVEPVPEQEWEAACRMLFGYLPRADQEARTATAVRLLREGELPAEGLLVARRGQVLLGGLLCMPIAGAGSLLWPPQVAAGPDRPAIEDALVQHALAWLRQRGAKLTQALLPPEEAPLAVPLLRNAFRHVTRLWYLRHDLVPGPAPPARLRLRFETYQACNREAFHDTLLGSYEGTLDCPEVNGVRTLEEILEGHQAQGPFDPARWWLASQAGEPVGVLLLAAMPEWQGWDLSYVGVVPKARRQGVGRGLVLHALAQARAAQVAQLTLSVDARNLPARELYRRLGFYPYDEREVYLAIGT